MNSLPKPPTWFAIGVGLYLLSVLWPILVGGKRAYTEEDALEYQQASQALHQLAHAAHHSAEDLHPVARHAQASQTHHPQTHPTAHLHADSHLHAGHTNPESHAQPGTKSTNQRNDLKAAKDRFAVAVSKRDAARNRGKGIATVLRLLAYASLLCGLVVFAADRFQDS